MTAVNLNRVVRGPVTAVPVVAGKGVRLVADTVNNRFVVEADETVLWEGTYNGNGSITLNEALSNFEFVRIEWCPYTETQNWLAPKDSVTTKVFDNQIHLTGIGISTSLTYQMLVNLFLSVSGTTISELYQGSVTLHAGANNENLRGYQIYKVTGINRIANN